jgi:hypothetical protein
MDITIERDYDFTPKWNDNDKDPNPIVFHMRRLTTAERDKLIDYSVGSNGEMNMHVDRQGMLVRAVKKIDRLSVNGTAITTAKDMLDQPGLSLLMTEAVADIIGENGRTDLKNSS